MKPSCKIFYDYIKKYPSKRVCLRILYKDYKVKDDDKDKFRQAFDLVKGNIDAGGTGTQAESQSEEVEVEQEKSG